MAINPYPLTNAPKRLSPRCLLIARVAQASKHSQRYVVVKRGLAYATNATSPPESLP